ncbi:MAG: hypothetical protein V8T45_11485 [Oscillospiraceae bacterium]
MPVGDRAAQFAPFAALTGYEDAVEEAARLTESKIELDRDRIEELDRGAVPSPGTYKGEAQSGDKLLQARREEGRRSFCHCLRPGKENRRI